MKAQPGDKVIRRYDGRMGKVEQEGTVPGYCMVRFEDTRVLLPVMMRDLRVLEREMHLVSR